MPGGLDIFKPMLSPIPSSKKGAATSVKLRVAHYNARTANAQFTQGKAGRLRRARSKALRIQMSQECTHLVGIQEARTPQGTRRADGFHIISTGPDNMGLVVELWVNLQLAFATKGAREYLFDTRNFKVLTPV